MGRRTWVKLFCDNWLRGSIRAESFEIRSVFTDLLVLAGDSAYGDDGIIQLANGVGFTDEIISGILNIPLEIWLKAKERLSNHPDKNENRITINPINQGFSITIINWKLYQSEYQRQKYQRHHKRLEEKCEKSAKKVQERCGEKEKEKEKEKENTNKIEYAKYVRLTIEEYNTLISKYGETNTKKFIEKLDNYKGSNGKKYKSDYRAILNWVVEEILKNQKQSKFDAAREALKKEKEAQSG